MGRDEVPIYWYCFERQEPIAPYNQIIRDFGTIPDYRLRNGIKRSVDELFTENEVNLLQDYLTQTGVMVEIEQIELPVHQHFWNFGSMPYGGLDKKIPLYTHKGYSLPFKVEGHLDAEGCPLSRN